MKTVLCVWALVQALSLTQAQDRPVIKECDPCTEELELGIVLDSSSSIMIDEFGRAQEFLQDYLKNFVISPSGVRVSIITYGRTTHPEDSFNLTTYNNNDDVNDAIGLLPHRATTYTSTGAAIQFMRENQLNEATVRPGVPKVGLVITDGRSQEQEVTADQAQKARDENIIMFAIGVGHKVDAGELMNIAGKQDRVDRVDSYDKLQTITKWLAKETCVGRS